MINLLPPEEKQKLLLEKKEKLSLVLWLTVLVFLICLILILLSIKFYILAESDGSEYSLDQIKKQTQSPAFIDLNSAVQKYNKILSRVDSFYAQEIYFNKVLDAITKVPSPAGLYLTNFALTRDDKGLVVAGVSGISNTRDNLIIFKQSIESDAYIKDSYFSPESWISPQNAKFSLTFKVTDNSEKNEK